MIEQVTIDRRFNGPPDSGHGGYVCGVVAGLIGGPVEVTLRRPPPLDRPLEVRPLDGGGVALSDGETVIADGAPASAEIEVPEPVGFPEAEAASRSYVGFRQHAFPTCFGCGPQHSEGDGLRIFPGQVEGRNIVAAPWTPDATLTDEGGTVRPEFAWAALDCTGGWALLAQLPERPVVLGRMAAKRLAARRGWPQAVLWHGPFLRGRGAARLRRGHLGQARLTAAPSPTRAPTSRAWSR
jgi:hypothetical protein